MFFGRDMPGKTQRAEWGRRFVQERSPYALAAGMLGIAAPIDGLIFVPLSLAAIVLAILGWRHIDRHPGLLGKRLCALGLVGGVIGCALFIALRVWAG